MEQSLIVSVSGIRGLVGQTLTAEAALHFASALGTHLGGGRVVVARDGRPSGHMLRHAVLAGLLEAGCEVHDLGVAATPTVGLAVRRLQAVGGIQITASHNPAPWNGLKLFGADGRILSAAHGKQIASRFDHRASSAGPGTHSAPSSIARGKQVASGSRPRTDRCRRYSEGPVPRVSRRQRRSGWSAWQIAPRRIRHIVYLSRC